MNRKEWIASINWPPRTDERVIHELFAQWSKRRSIWVAYGDPLTGKHCMVLSDCVHGPVSVTGRMCCIAGVDAMPDRIVAISGGFDRHINKPTHVFYEHPSLHYDARLKGLRTVMIEDRPAEDGCRWSIMDRREELARFASLDSALRFLTVHGLTVHSLEDLYAE